MDLYRYTSNKDPQDGTTVIVPDPDDRERLVHQGGEIELSEDEAKRLRERFNLTKVSEEEVQRRETEESAEARAETSDSETRASRSR